MKQIVLIVGEVHGNILVTKFYTGNHLLKMLSFTKV